MRRSAFVPVLLLAMLPAHAGEFWSALWRNADQRGEALLRQGDAGQAARVYADPARKAYAKLSAGDYQGAAKDLAGIQGSDAAYNRGNALAHSGDLQGALDAYDAALKSDPNNRDAKHNRELVAQILKQQQSQQQKSGDKSSTDDKHEGQQGEGQDASAQDKNSSGQNGEQQQDGQKQNTGQGKRDENSAKTAQQANKNPETSRQNGTGGQSRDEQVRNEKSKTGAQDGQDKQGRQAAAKDEAGQARRDAQASLAQAGSDTNSQTGNERYASPALSDQNKPANSAKTENQLAQEQWLRSIPDDPGGLLRRKFMIEHMIRLQKAQQ